MSRLDYSSAQSARARLLTLAEAAQLTGTSVRWWRTAVFERRLPVVRLGRLVRIDPDDLEAFIEGNREPARSEEVGPIRQLRRSK